MFNRTSRSILIAGIAGALVSFAPQVLAACSGFTCSNVFITRLIPWASNNMLWIATSGDEAHLNPCQAEGGVYIGLPLSNPMFSQIHDELFAAFMNKKRVTIRTTESGTCTLIYSYVR